MSKSLWDFLWVDYDLRKRQRWARERDERIFARPDPKPESVRRVLVLAQQVGQQEYDRETNLNARGAAVATVAGLIVAVSGAVTKSLFPGEGWTDWTRIVTLGLFVGAIFLVASSMFMAVCGVLRPQRGARTKNYLGETLMGLWVHDREHDKLLKADGDRVDLVCLDRALRTVPEWHIRNRSKARWLRRSWMFLLGGVLLVALAAVFLLVHLLGIQGPEPKAEDYQWWHLPVFLLGLVVLALGAVRSDFPLFAGRLADKRADRRPDSPDEAETKSIKTKFRRASAEVIFNAIGETKATMDKFPNASAEEILNAIREIKQEFPKALAREIVKAIEQKDPEASAAEFVKDIQKIKNDYPGASAEDIGPLLEIELITKELPEPLSASQQVASWLPAGG